MSLGGASASRQIASSSGILTISKGTCKSTLTEAKKLQVHINKDIVNRGWVSGLYDDDDDVIYLMLFLGP